MVGLAAWRLTGLSRQQEVVFEGKTLPLEAGPLCPWRDPTADLKALFPEATSIQIERHILSGARTELARSLGRLPKGDENLLQVHRVYHNDRPVGAILLRRVKGDYGAIELVLGVDSDGRTRAVRLQRLREPPAVATALEDAEFLGRFVGRSAADLKRVTEPATISTVAQHSAAAITEGVRSLLILLAAAEAKPTVHDTVASHH